MKQYVVSFVEIFTVHARIQIVPLFFQGLYLFFSPFPFNNFCAIKNKQTERKDNYTKLPTLICFLVEIQHVYGISIRK